MKEGKMLFANSVSRVNGFHTHIESKNEIIEIETQSQSVGHGNLLVKLVDLKLSAGLICVITERPNVSCINEKGPVEFPKEVSA